MKPIKDPHLEAFSGESEVVKVARWACYRTHQPNFEQEGSYNLSSTLQEMATFTNLLGTKIHEMQESWASWKDLKAVYQSAKSFPKDIYLFRVVLPTKSPKIMGLKGIHSPKALWQQGGLTFCLWCRKEGQN